MSTTLNAPAMQKHMESFKDSFLHQILNLPEGFDLSDGSEANMEMLRGALIGVVQDFLGPGSDFVFDMLGLDEDSVQAFEQLDEFFDTKMGNMLDKDGNLDHAVASQQMQDFIEDKIKDGTLAFENPEAARQALQNHIDTMMQDHEQTGARLDQDTLEAMGNKLAETAERYGGEMNANTDIARESEEVFDYGKSFDCALSPQDLEVMDENGQTLFTLNDNFTVYSMDGSQPGQIVMDEAGHVDEEFIRGEMANGFTIELVTIQDADDEIYQQDAAGQATDNTMAVGYYIKTENGGFYVGQDAIQDPQETFTQERTQQLETNEPTPANAPDLTQQASVQALQQALPVAPQMGQDL